MCTYMYKKSQYILERHGWRDQKSFPHASHHLLPGLQLLPSQLWVSLQVILQSCVAVWPLQDTLCHPLCDKPHLHDSSDSDILWSVSGKAETLRVDRSGLGKKKNLFCFFPLSQDLPGGVEVTGASFWPLSLPPLSPSSGPVPHSTQPSQAQ